MKYWHKARAYYHALRSWWTAIDTYADVWEQRRALSHEYVNVRYELLHLREQYSTLLQAHSQLKADAIIAEQVLTGVKAHAYEVRDAVLKRMVAGR